MYFVALSSTAFRSQLRQSKQLVRSLRRSPRRRARRSTAASTSSVREVVRQHASYKRERRQRADADFETVRRRHAVVRVVLHVPQVAELVLGARTPAGSSTRPASRSR